MSEEEIKTMTEEERIRQLEWSDQHEFSYSYAYYLLEENKQLKSVLKEIREYIKEFTFEPLLVCEDRKLIICNQNLRKLEEIIDKGIGEDNG